MTRESVKSSGCPRNERIFRYIIAAQLLIAALIAVFALAGEKRGVAFAADELSSEAGVVRDGARFIDASYGYQGYFTSTPTITLPRGSYTVTLDMTCDADHLNIIETQVTGGSALYDERMLMPPCDGEVSFDVWATSATATLSVKTFYQYGALAVRGATIKENAAMATSALALFALVCAAADIIALLFVKGPLKKGQNAARAAFFALSALVVISSLPLLVAGLKEGHDLPFHLMRLEGVADALRNGQLPARVYPFAINGYGYASGLFYPDLFLYPAALLRLCGLPLQFCYKFALLLANLLSAICGYFGFKAIFKNRAAGVAGAAFMTFASYRLVNVWLRSAVGEAFAMAFFPLALAALWLLLREPTDSPDFKKGALFGVVGFGGVIQSHIISCELIGLFALAACVVCIKRVFEKKRLFALLKTAGLTLALNAWFIVPLLDMLRGDYAVNSVGAGRVSYELAEQALFPSQLFKLNGRCAGLSLDLAAGPSGDMPLGMGLLLMAAALLFVIVYIVKKGRFRFAKAGMLALLGAAALMFMTTYLFPWRWLSSLPVIGSLASVLQFPWRLMSLVTLLLAFVGCAGVAALDKRSLKIAACALLAAAVTQLAFFFSAYNINYKIVDTLGLHSASVGNGEYLPEGCDINALNKTAPLASGVEVTAYDKNGLTIDMTLSNAGGADGSVTLPLLYYPGYAARSADGGALAVDKGESGALELRVPAGFEGEVGVDYKGKAVWRAFDALSSLTLVACAAFEVKRRKKAG